MSRALFRLVLVLAGLATFVGAEAQQAGKTYRIATLSYPTLQTPAGVALMASFREAMRDLRWIDGRNVVIERRATELEAIPGLMAGATRAFPVASAGLIRGLSAGDPVRFTLERRAQRVVLVAIEPERKIP